MKQFRTNGAIGALLDEYEKAIHELNDILGRLTNEQLHTVVDAHTSDPDCHSIQSILSHVVRSGYAYAIYIQKQQGELVDIPERQKLESATQYQEALLAMFRYNEAVFDQYPDLEMETLEPEKKIKTNWGQLYDVEQLMEHAVLHILRHRRQIERFLLLLNGSV